MQNIKDELRRLEEKGTFRSIPNIDAKFDGKIIVDGREYINYASNDYLGLSTKIELRKEFLSENNSLMSSASARLLTGSSAEYSCLERTVSKIFNKESALIFNTGYQANLGVVSSLIGKGDVVFCDKLNHASIIDGMQLSQGDFYRYKHLDYDNLETLLQKRRDSFNRALIVSESVFSMDGDVADIDRLIELKRKYNCMLMIDEAHAFCAAGESLAGLSYGKDVDIITATFGKAVGSFGAFCVSSSEIISYLTNKARSFIFSTSIPPINIAWSDWLLTKKRDFVISQKNKLNNLVKDVHELLGETPSSTHIIPIIIGDNDNTLKISEKLKAEGYYVPAIRPPTVPVGSSRLRVSLTADCKIDDFKRFLSYL